MSVRRVLMLFLLCPPLWVGAQEHIQLLQEKITNRLLEAEKAERQREFDNKRKAETASEKKREFPPSLKEYIKKREAELEMYKTVSPALRPYYKYLVDEYYKALKGE